MDALDDVRSPQNE